MSQVFQLYRLQQIDSEIASKKGRLTEVIQSLGENAEMVRAGDRMELTDRKLSDWRTKYNSLNHEIEAINFKAAQSEKRLYSGTVTNPKELTDLQNEIESLGRRSSLLEDDLLEAMIMVEESELEFEAAEASYTDIKRRWTKDQENLAVQRKNLAQDLHNLTLAREKSSNQIDSGLLDEYSKIAARRGGVAVAVVQGDRCLGCRLTQSANTLKEVREGKKVYCSSCGRILVVV